MLLPWIPLAVFAAAPSALTDYLVKPDASFAWKPSSNIGEAQAWDLTSQTWQGIPWRHTVTLTRPARNDAKDGCILLITGGKPNATDLGLVKALSDRARIPVAILFDIPNQPIDGRVEDDLIAHTFERYLATGDASWPLLFPMTKSALRAMDLLQAATAESSQPLRRFVVTGASKRGWTTWFVGVSGDPRVAGIAPMVIDNLNLKAQMRHQRELWGAYSPQIDDYTRRGLQALLETPAGQRLAEMVDPYSYRERLRCPVLIVNGANDAYWTVDALSLYWSDLPRPKSALLVPNAGHGLGDKLTALNTIAAFGRACLGRKPWPAIEWTRTPNGMDVTIRGYRPVSSTVWVAESDSNNFSESQWKPLPGPTLRGKGPWQVRLETPRANKPFAWFGNFRFQEGPHEFDLTTGAVLEKLPPQN